MGHTVHVLTTFPNYPSGVVPAEWRGKFFWQGSDTGINLHRVWSYATPNREFLKRILGHFSFAFFACLAAPLLPAVDVVIVESHPLFNGIAGAFITLIKRARYVLNVSDLWPQSAIEMGVLKNRMVIWIAQAVEMFSYRRASLILAMANGIRTAIIRDGIDPSRVKLFLNAVDYGLFRPNDGTGHIRRKVGIAEQDFVVLYAGTIGLAHGLKTILDSAAQCLEDGHSRIRFVLAGDGAEKYLLQTEAARRKLTNVLFIDPVPKQDLPNLLNAADALVVCLRNLPVFQGVVPTKVLEGMSCGKPIVGAVAGEAASLLREADAGICVGPENPRAMRDAILRLMADPQEGFLMGQRGRKYIQQHFCRDRRAAQLQEWLESGNSASVGPGVSVVSRNEERCLRSKDPSYEPPT
jgi:glycosyltransferase involved in cell wall biosynthesis